VDLQSIISLFGIEIAEKPENPHIQLLQMNKVRLFLASKASCKSLVGNRKYKNAVLNYSVCWDSDTLLFNLSADRKVTLFQCKAWIMFNRPESLFAGGNLINYDQVEVNEDGLISGKYWVLLKESRNPLNCYSSENGKIHIVKQDPFFATRIYKRRDNKLVELAFIWSRQVLQRNNVLEMKSC